MRTPLSYYAPQTGELDSLLDLQNDVLPVTDEKRSEVPAFPVAAPPPAEDPYIQYQQNPDMAPAVGAEAPMTVSEATPSPETDPHSEYEQGLQIAVGDKPIEAPPEAPRLGAPPQAVPTNGDPSKLVSAKPPWYDMVAPPETSAAPGVIGGLGLGILGALLARKNPGVAAGLAGLGGVSAMQAIANQPQREYENRLSAAERQADMMKTLGKGQPGSLEWWRAQNTFQRQEDARKKAEAAADEKAQLEDMTSELSERERQAAISLVNGLPIDSARKKAYIEAISRMNGAEVRRYRPQLGQYAGQERGQGNALVMQGVRDSSQIAQEGRAEQRQIAQENRAENRQLGKEDREREATNEEREIHGYHYKGKRAPNVAAAEKARTIADNSGIAQEAAGNMVQLWKQLSTKARTLPGWLEGALSDEDRGIVNELRTWGMTLDSAQRALANMGVPQQFEMEMIRNVSPDATGIRALLNDGQAWAAQGRVLHKLTNKRMQNYGYFPDEGDQAPAAPQGSGKSAAQKLAESGDAVRSLAPEAGKIIRGAVEGAGKTAEAVAGAAGVNPAEAEKLFQVQVYDPIKQKWGKVVTVTEEALKTGQAAGAKKGLLPEHYRITPVK